MVSDGVSGAAAESLLVEKRDRTAWLTLNRPGARNAINWELRRALAGALADAADDQEIGAVVIRANGSVFCAGGDVKEMGNGPTDTLAKLTLGSVIVETIAGMPKPVVAAVQGPAVGAGFSLALACDLVVADPAASFSAMFVERALVPDMGLTHWLERQVGLLRAKDIVLTARTVEVSEAQQLGLIARMYPTEGFDSRLAALVHRLANGPTEALGSAKLLLNRGRALDLGPGLRVETLEQVRATGSAAHLDSVRAFQQRPVPAGSA